MNEAMRQVCFYELLLAWGKDTLEKLTAEQIEIIVPKADYATDVAALFV